jgi:mRNA-degrading endonuclease RelE of RelBE toxin-antitoxin system
MEGYLLELSPAAYRDLKVLPHEIQKSITLNHLPRIAERPYNVSKPLMGSLQGEKSYHFGRRPEYRIIYSHRGEDDNGYGYWFPGGNI